MDFEGLFWIALLVFYFVIRAVGGKKSRPSPRPTEGQNTRPDRSRTAPSSSESDPQLDEALLEIRRALGFPVEEKQPTSAETAEPPEARAGEAEADVARRRAAEADERRRREAQRAAELERRSRESRRARDIEAGRRRDAEEAARQRELLERAEAARSPDRSRIPKPAVSRRRGPIGAHPMESSFTEEEIFERTGRHPHVEVPGEDEKTAARRREVSTFRDRLHDRSSLREAFILKEVLDEPLALRGRR